MINKIYINTIISLGLIFSSLANAAPKCQDIFHNTEEVMLFDKKVTIIKISPEEKIPGEVFIGIEPGGHTYLIAGNHRYDGRMFFRKAILKDSVFSEGIIIRINAELAGTFQYYFNEIERAGDCVMAACNVLEQSNLQVNGQPLKTYSPYNLLKTIIQNGFKLNGENVGVTIFVRGEETVESLVYQTTLSYAFDSIFNGRLELLLRETFSHKK